MKYTVKQNWASTLDLMRKKPVLIVPFLYIAFFQILALEIIYFSTRKPLSIALSPIIRKFFGENALHYPGNMMILPKLFYYADIVIYISIAVLLTAISLNTFKNIKNNLPLKLSALIKNAMKKYFALAIFGIVAVALMAFVKKADVFLFTKTMHVIEKHLNIGVPGSLHFLGLSLILFISNLIAQILIISTIPIMVIRGKGLIKAFWGSIRIGLFHFFTMARILLLPLLIYLPLSLLNSGAPQLVDRTFPEITALMTLMGSIVSIFIDSFMILCVAQFIIDTEPKK